jgi:hypothetical protein
MQLDRTYWRSQPDKRLVEAVLQDGQTDPELCIALAEALDNALTTIEAQQDEIYKWEQANGYD